MYRLILPLLCLLAACAAPAARQSYRDAGTPIYSNAAFDVARLQGDWVQVAGFAAQGSPTCRSGGAMFSSVTAMGQTLAAQLCVSGQEAGFKGRIRQVAPGRLALVGADPAGIGQEWWVIWVDTDSRTLVIGTPSGDFGFILNRGRALPADRLAAAREILDWNGYDLTRLQVFD
ncbi:MAG: lipocalin family protein [Paracoccaceae bacterium]|nr:lipocalin family protein [Paracoccaceae bacterium]